MKWNVEWLMILRTIAACLFVSLIIWMKQKQSYCIPRICVNLFHHVSARMDF